MCCNAWAKFRDDFGKTTQRINRSSSAAESKAKIARMWLDRSGYAEVVDLMKALKESKVTNDCKLHYHIPYSVNPRFGGRQDALDAVKQALDLSEGIKRQRSFALWGMGGVGKTQIALRYAPEGRPHSDNILWISAKAPYDSLEAFRG